MSLRVLLHAFSDTDLVWFSTVYGEFDDNVLLVALDRATAQSYPQIKHPTIAPIKVAWADEPDFEEYVLSDAIQADLGIRCDENLYFNKPSSLIQFQIDIHDDCFFTMKLIEPELLKKLVYCILQQHSFYLGVEVD